MFYCYSMVSRCICYNEGAPVLSTGAVWVVLKLNKVCISVGIFKDTRRVQKRTMKKSEKCIQFCIVLLFYLGLKCSNCLFVWVKQHIWCKSSWRLTPQLCSKKKKKMRMTHNLLKWVVQLACWTKLIGVHVFLGDLWASSKDSLQPDESICKLRLLS